MVSFVPKRYVGIKKIANFRDHPVGLTWPAGPDVFEVAQASGYSDLTTINGDLMVI